MTAYTIAFGVLLIAALLMLILSLEVLESPSLVSVTALIPLGMALGMVSEFRPVWLPAALAAALAGLAGAVFSRLLKSRRQGAYIIAAIHGAAGWLIVLLPWWIVINEEASIGFLMVSLGGIFISLAGLMLLMVRIGKPAFTRQQTLRFLPPLLLLATACFVVGFSGY
jgi:hypothetical protein